MSSPAVTLFSEALDQGQRPVTVVVSAVVHVAVIALVFFGILNAPKIDTHAAERLTVRTLDFHMPPPPPIRRAANKIDYPGAHRPKAPAPAHPAGGSAPPPPQTAKMKMAPQTILQPDLTKQLALKEELPVPKMLIWSPPVKVVQKIVAPPPKMTAAETKALLNALNHEVKLADVSVASSLAKTAKLPMMPSTTTPLTVHGPKLPQAVPSTVSQVTAPPNPAAILSASDVAMNEGAVELPPVNESALADLPVTSIDPGLAAGNGAGSGTGKHPGAGQGSAPAGPAQQSSAVGLGQGDAATQITMPRNGQFGSVVVGASLQDQFPEIAGLWGGRMTYTVYLHVGLARSWILEYSLPYAAKAVLAANGERLEAPWPYSIVRPNLGSGDINADALMVHGFVNQAGQFENLSVIFPQAFPQAQFVLQSLARWHFRPATHNGSNARVEVLLIIPEALN